METRYSVTCLHKDGERKFALPALQRRHTWGTREEAEAWLAACLAQPDNLGRLDSIHGVQSRGTFRVDAFECYNDGDPTGWYACDD